MTDWAIAVYRDGQPITGPVPVGPWDTASILARLVAGLTGGPVSVMAAVHTHNRDSQDAQDGQQLSLEDVA